MVSTKGKHPKYKLSDSHPCVVRDVDARRRNSFKNQPELLKWNLLKLAEAIQDALPLQQSSSAVEEL